MAKKLIGIDPDQVPSNAHLGDMAYQGKDVEVASIGVGTRNQGEEDVRFLLAHDGHGIAMDYTGATLPKQAGLFTSSTAHTQTAYGDLNIKARTDYGGYYGIGFFTASSNNTPVRRAYFNSTGNLVFESGKGIDFSASEGSGASSSILDDYEEGTWTPTLSYGTGVTYGSQLGKYIKIGRMVYIEFYVVVTAHTNTDTSFIHLASLPFTPDENDTLIATLNTPECTLLKRSDADSRPSSGGRIVNLADINFCGQGSTYIRYDDCNGSGDFFGAATYYASS